MLTKSVDQSLGTVEDQDDKIEAQCTIHTLHPRITQIKRKHRQRAAEHETEGEYSARLEADLGELIKRLSQFEHLTSYWDWEIFRNRFEKMAKHEHIS